jgi:low temperature requirement protein LtrA
MQSFFSQPSLRLRPRPRLRNSLRPVKSFFTQKSLRALSNNDDGEETWHELFFDLVYVAAALQLGDMIKYSIKYGGFGVSTVLFTAMRVSWDQLVEYQNR